MRFYEMEEEQVGGGEEEEEEVVVVGSTSKKDGGGVRVGWSPYERVVKMASGNAVVVFSVSGCCMCHVVKRLLLGLGVGPIVYELDQIDGGVSREVEAVLSQLLSSSTTTVTSAGTTSAVVVEGPSVGGGAAVPAVFIGGKLLGGVEKVMACHINGSLVPLLKQAGALWL